MIVFNTVRFKNFMAYGNAMTEVGLRGQGKVLITGKNGHGKSAIGEAIFFALYGKPFRKIKKDELVNSINKKNLLVEIEFSVNGKDVMVRRGIKPNVLEVYIDGKQMNKDAAVIDQQKYIEQNILGMSDKSFKQIVLLGSDMYVPFMLLSAAERRKFIDNLMDTNVYSVMSDITKSMLGDEKLVISKMEMDVSKLELTINEREHRLHDLLEMKHQAKMDLGSELQAKKNELEEVKKNGKYLSEKMKAHKELEHNLSLLKSEIAGKQQALDTLKNGVNDVCPVCQRPMDVEHIEQKQLEISTLEHQIEQLLKQVDVLEHEKDDAVVSEYHQAKADYRRLQNDIGQLEGKLAALQQADDLKISELQEQIENLKQQKKELESQLNKAQKRALYMQNFVEMLKDDGIRSVVINKYLPTINSLIAHYLDVLGFDILFEFDGNFNERIVKQGKDFVYRQLSAGQRLRIDLCLLFTWRDLARMRNQANTNLVIFDEIGSSTLDADGVQAFIDLLASHTDNDTSIVISHNENISPYFDKHLHVELHGSFSKIELH